MGGAHDPSRWRRRPPSAPRPKSPRVRPRPLVSSFRRLPLGFHSLVVRWRRPVRGFDVAVGAGVCLSRRCLGGGKGDDREGREPCLSSAKRNLKLEGFRVVAAAWRPGLLLVRLARPPSLSGDWGLTRRAGSRCVRIPRGRRLSRAFIPPRDPIRGHCQAGSLTGAVHLPNNNAGVLRAAQRGQKPRVEQKGKSCFDPDVQ